MGFERSHNIETGLLQHYWMLGLHAAAATAAAALGMPFQLGLEITGLVGHVYPCVHLCVREERGWKEGEISASRTKLQRQHVHSLTLPAC